MFPTSQLDCLTAPSEESGPVAMANPKPTRELTATEITLLPVNIPEKLGQASFCSCLTRPQSSLFLLKIFHCTLMYSMVKTFLH